MHDPYILRSRSKSPGVGRPISTAAVIEPTLTVKSLLYPFLSSLEPDPFASTFADAGLTGPAPRT